MKTIFTLLMTFFLSVNSIAQSGISYKAVIKDVSGNIIVNQNIDVQFNILEGPTTVYSETYQPFTNENGIIVLTIGNGVTSDDFNAINWTSDDHFLNVQVNTGSGLVDLGTTQFMAVPYAINAANVTGLEAIDEGNGIGWRLVGSNPDNYGNIGSDATDLSHSDLNSTTYGATGTNSTTMGIRTTASGDSSLALGSDSTASDDFSTAIGAGAMATGGSSMALGVGSQATENSATAIGYNTTASGFASTTLGYYSEASGYYSTGIGNYTQAGAHSSVAIGRYNNGYGSATTWNTYDPIFEIGNGTSDSNRNNALTVYKSGIHEINSSTTGLVINALESGINIENSGVDGITIYNPDDDGISISYPGDDGITISNPADNGIVVSNATIYGADIEGDVAGLLVSSLNDNPDIILGTSSFSNGNDDGIISTNPERAGSDMFLRSYDAVVVQLDYDDNENGNFRIRNSDQDVVFDVNESGTVSMGDILRIGDINIERTVFTSMDFLRINSSIMPNQDAQHILGTGTNRWINVWAVDGTINTSDRREKKNIENLNYGLNEVLQMKPVSFNWKNKNNQDTKLGLIAQDLQVLIPEVVKSHTWEKDEVTGLLSKKEIERLGVYYSDLVPVLINAIKEQQKIINNEKSINAKQNSQLLTLLSRVQDLENNQSN